MNMQESSDKYFDAIMELRGVDEFKETVRRLRRFQQNAEKYSITPVALPNYLWVARRGGGVSTCANALAEYLYSAKIIEFTGVVKYFEYKLAYIEPDAYFSELSVLDNTLSEIAGHHRYFRGLACIDIDDWVQHTNEVHFHKFLEYIEDRNDKVLAILCIHADNKRVVESLESSLSSYIRFESVTLRFPNADELVEFIETDCFKQQGLYLTDDAKSLLAESIESIINGKHFNGFTTIKQLANDIIYNLLTSKMRGYEISAAMLSEFRRDSAYIKRIKAFVGAKAAMGFNVSRAEPSI